MKYYHNNKKILLVLTSMFIFSLMFIACNEKKHRCPVCPPDDYSGYIGKDTIARKIYPFLNGKNTRKYRFVYYTLMDPHPDYPYVDTILEYRSRLCAAYNTRDTGKTFYYGKDCKDEPYGRMNLFAVFHNVDSSLCMTVFTFRQHMQYMQFVQPARLNNGFPLMFFPASKYFVGKKWENLNGSTMEPAYREIISIDEVITTPAGTFDNVIKIKEVWRGWGGREPDYAYIYVRNDIGIIKSIKYSYFNNNELEFHASEELVEMNF